MALGAYFSFFYKNYFRSHRYLREIVLLVIFNVFFWGFLYGPKAEDAIWTVFGVLALLLTMVTTPSVFFLEKDNSLYFALMHPNGRLKFLFSKFLLIFTIDFLWLFLFTIIYGIRFHEGVFFALLGPRLALMCLLLVLSILLIGLSFTFKPWIAWVVLMLIVFGGIINKTALFPLHSLKEAYAVLTFALPPFLEIIFGAVTMQFDVWRIVFLSIAIIQIALYLYINAKLILHRDFI